MIDMPEYRGRLLMPAVIVIMLLLFSNAGCSNRPTAELGEKVEAAEVLTETVTLGGREFALELAQTPEKRGQGLMGREFLGENEGMLFVYPANDNYPAVLTFWMKDCLIPLDIIFITGSGKVAYVHEMALPEPGIPDSDLTRYTSHVPVQFAIEIRGGLVGELNIKKGDAVQLRTDHLISIAE